MLNPCKQAWVRERCKHSTTFRRLWREGADRVAWYTYAHTLAPSLTMEEWDRAWQYCQINDESKAAAICEMSIALTGTF